MGFGCTGVGISPRKALGTCSILPKKSQQPSRNPPAHSLGRFRGASQRSGRDCGQQKSQVLVVRQSTICQYPAHARLTALSLTSNPSVLSGADGCGSGAGSGDIAGFIEFRLHQHDIQHASPPTPLNSRIVLQTEKSLQHKCGEKQQHHFILGHLTDRIFCLSTSLSQKDMVL
jgi:hypothetical protein